MKTIRFFNPSGAPPRKASRTGWGRAWGVASLLIAFIAFAGYREAPVITMTGAKTGAFTIALAGSGTAAIDWGDGSAPQAVTLSAYDEITGFTSSHSFAHDYAIATARTVTVTAGNITHLGCSANGLTAIDVSQNTALIYLNCGFNDLTALDVSKNTALTGLHCGYSDLTALDVSKNTALTYLSCFANKLTALDVSKNTALTNLSCSDNKLIAIDVSQNTALTILLCDGNKLTALDVSQNTALTDLNCDANGLTAIDVSKNTALMYLGCQENQLDAAGLDALFGTLHSNAGSKTLYIKGTPGAGICTQKIATAKGWWVNTTAD